ncbi:MAG: YdiY family protein [Vicinamibacterales bacterium]
MRFRIDQFVLCAVILIVATSSARAQPPAAPPKPTKRWTQTTSAGLALTSGNKHTSTINAGFEVMYDAGRRNLVKGDGLFLRGKSEGELSADRLGLNGRDEFRLTDGLYAFGQLQYLRDQFKDVAYLVAPTGGLGYRLAETPSTRASIDAGVGTVWEKRRQTNDLQTSAALNLTEKLSHTLSSAATLTQTLSALHRLDDFADALYTLNVALAASVTTRTQLKVELLDTFRNQVAADIQKNDVAVIVGMVFKR